MRLNIKKEEVKNGAFTITPAHSPQPAQNILRQGVDSLWGNLYDEAMTKSKTKPRHNDYPLTPAIKKALRAFLEAEGGDRSESSVIRQLCREGLTARGFAPEKE